MHLELGFLKAPASHRGCRTSFSCPIVNQCPPSLTSIAIFCNNQHVSGFVSKQTAECPAFFIHWKYDQNLITLLWKSWKSWLFQNVKVLIFLEVNGICFWDWYLCPNLIVMYDILNWIDRSRPQYLSQGSFFQCVFIRIYLN